MLKKQILPIIIAYEISIIFQEGDPDEKDEMMNPRVQDWMLICQYGAAFPQSEKDKDDHDGHWQAWHTPTSRNCHRSSPGSTWSTYVPQPAATTADPERLQGKQLVAYNIVCDHFKVQDRATPLRLIISGTAGTDKSYLIRCLKLLLAGQLCVTAPTGVAAFNVDSYTLHSLLRLPVKGDFKQLEGN